MPVGLTKWHDLCSRRGGWLTLFCRIYTASVKQTSWMDGRKVLSQMWPSTLHIHYLLYCCFRLVHVLLMTTIIILLLFTVLYLLLYLLLYDVIFMRNLSVLINLLLYE